MAQERPLTPEKQLLKLIENSKSKEPVSVQDRAIKRRSMSFFSFGAWLGRASFFRDSFRSHLSSGPVKQLDIKIINGLLFLSIIAMMAYFISSVSVSMLDLKKMPELKLKPSESAKIVSAPEASLLRTSSYYLDLVRQRNIFKIGQRIETAAQEPEKQRTPVIIEASQYLKLVGISWSNTPDAMIEDSKSLKTYFIKTGQMVGVLKVQAIFKDKVVLSFEGEEIELK